MKAFAINSIPPRSGKLSRVLTLFALPCLAMGLVMPGLVRADEGDKVSQTGSVAPKAIKPAAEAKLKANSGQKKEEKILVTGSLIPSKVSRLSGSLDTTFPVYIIDSQQIQRSGATGIASALNRYGMRR